MDHIQPTTRRLAVATVSAVAGLMVLSAGGAAADSNKKARATKPSLPGFIRLLNPGQPRGRDATLRVSIPLRTGDGRTHTHRIAVTPIGRTTSNIGEILEGAPPRIGNGVALRAETFWLHGVVGLNRPIGVPLPRLKGE
ncbi:MAG: hypothetical protein RLT05_34130 [Bauldia litoralis]